MTANEHPQWSFKYLQKRFKQHLKHNSDIARFKREILKGGTFLDKMDAIKKMFDCMIDSPKHESVSS